MNDLIKRLPMTDSFRPAISAQDALINPIVNTGFINDLLEQENSPPEHLKSAFELFNDLSVQLSDSYTVLEQRVADLTSELSVVSEQRMQELREKEQVANRLESLLSFLPGGVIVLDNHGVIVDINPTAEDMLESGLEGRLWREVIQHCFSPKSDDGHEVSNHKGQRINIATRSLGQDGQIILLTDQTNTRRLQAEVSRHERLTALGKMVSTLAHQVRTPLSSAMLYGSHLLNTTLSPKQQRQFTQKLLNRLHEMERQVRDMLLFVKSDIVLSDKITLAELQQCLLETMDISLQQQNITCSWDIEYPGHQICCNKDALVGALLNLINNSVQAMEDQGELQIVFQVSDNNMLTIMIEDNGIGIDDHIKVKVHELFYTTKSQGTGIGLTVVDTVAKSHGGTFDLLNNQPQGVCAQLILPIISEV
jgi:two-component system sensor histidine kinase FlrB